jgi:hypothetical protein
MNKKLTLAEAKELSIKKWEHIVAHDGSDSLLYTEYPEMENLKGDCGFCTYAYKSKLEAGDKMLNMCNYCPIVKQTGETCINKWKNWNFWKTTGNGKEYAQAVLDLVKSINIEE